jgi:hypothetical protein
LLPHVNGQFYHSCAAFYSAMYLATWSCRKESSLQVVYSMLSFSLTTNACDHQKQIYL